MDITHRIELPYKILQAYNQLCKNICTQMQIPQTAFDILMFLANNPDLNTARDIVEIRRIKPSLVSVNVDRLVNEGLIERKAIPHDRRKIILMCTQKAQPFIEQGRLIQGMFFRQLFHDIDEKQLKEFFQILETLDRNADKIMKGLF